MFNKNKTTLIQYPGGKTGSYTIPDGVTSIGYATFVGCNGLKSVIIPNSVTSIGSDAFSGCIGLKSVTIGSGVITIGNNAFQYCDSLTSITIPNNVTSIGDEAFSYCTYLTSVSLGSGVANIGNQAFYSCSGLTSITIPDSVTSIGSNAFDSCSKLTSVTIPAGVTSIGSNAFLSCTLLTTITVNTANSAYSSVDGVLFNRNKTTLFQCPGGKTGNYTIPNSVTSIANGAFNNCAGLTGITIPNSVTSIGDAVFTSCTSLKNIAIPDSVTSIGTVPFYNCSGLVTATIGNGITGIGNNAFYYCSDLTSVTIGSNVTSIGSNVFYYCSSLTNVTIGSSVKTIGDGAFYDCTGLTSITLPGSVTSIGGYAFGGCTGLTAVYFQGNAPSLGSSVFFGDNNATVYYSPGTTGWGSTFGGLPTGTKTVTVTLTVTANPSQGGSVTGGGTFESGSSCKVTAKAKSGYTFVNWTENDIVVSSSAIYSFTINGNRDLVANFTPQTGDVNFGTFDNKKNVKLTLKDCNNNDVTFSISGPGYGQIDSGDCTFSSIALYNTTEKSVLTIKTKGKIKTSIGSVIVTGSLKGISAKTTNLQGDITVTGSLGILTIGDAKGDNKIKIGPPAIPNPKAAVTIVFDRVAGLTVNSPIPIKSISATEWLGGSIDAPLVSSITTKGDKKRGIAGNLDVDVIILGNIGAVKVAGTLSGEWNCNMVKSITTLDLDTFNLKLTQTPDTAVKVLSLGTLTVKGYFSGSNIKSAGHIGTITAGIMTDSNCFAGVTEGITGLPPADKSSFSQMATIKSVAIKGIKGESAPFFTNSNLAAMNILSASIVYPKSDNGGVPFGVSADNIGKLTIKKNDGNLASLKNLGISTDSTTIDGLEIRLY